MWAAQWSYAMRDRLTGAPFSGGPQPVARRCARCPTERFCNTSPLVWCSLSLLIRSLTWANPQHVQHLTRPRRVVDHGSTTRRRRVRCCTCCGFAQVKLLISNDNEHHTSGDVLQKRSVGHLAQRRATGWGPPENAQDTTFSEDAQHLGTGNQPNPYAPVRNLVTRAFRHAGYASIAHARRRHGRDDRRILAARPERTLRTPGHITQTCRGPWSI